MLKRRIARLEKLYREREAEAPKPEPFIWTAEDCAQALRNLIDDVAHRPHKENKVLGSVEDPLPTLSGEVYLIATWYWLIKQYTKWPRCYGEAAVRICGHYLLSAKYINHKYELTRKAKRVLEQEIPALMPGQGP
jgi:hypothetical protein